MEKRNVFKIFGKGVLSILLAALLTSILISSVLTAYFVGYSKGYLASGSNTEVQKEASMIEEDSLPTSTPKATSTPAPTIKPKPVATQKPWGGPDLWDAVNKRRVEFGVNPLKQRDELCTIASIRLNQLLELGKLDGHAGFSSLPNDRPDLKWIFDKYNISEFLVSGAESAEEAVSLWENTLGHKKLLSGGEYSFGCIYAQNNFGVAIAAY